MQDINARDELSNHQTKTLRLSRMKNELSSMMTELHSYRCEPCTPEMYRQFVKLEDNARRLKQTIEDTFKLLTSSNNVSENIADEIFGVTDKFQKFQKNLSFYKSKAIVHH